MRNAPALPGVEVLWRRLDLALEDLDEVLGQLPDLRWLHSDTVGVERLPLRHLAQRGITVTNGGDSFALPMAEWVILAMLAASKQFPHFLRCSDAGTWDATPPEVFDLEGTAAVVLGLGATGQLVARLASGLGVTITASVRTPRKGRPQGVEHLAIGEEWKSRLPDAKFLVVTVPLTPQTRGMVDAAALAALPRGAWVINVARGDVVDEEALLDALDCGHLGGAVLDTLPVEPLPAAHPLWRRPNVVVLPHTTWRSPSTQARQERLFARQLLQWTETRTLIDPVDLVSGY